MTRSIIALATAAAISVAAVPAAVAQSVEMGMGLNMLTGAIYNELVQRNLDTSNINNLSLSQLAIIKGIIDGDDSEGKKTQRIEAILNR